MNIFATGTDPVVAARNLDDRRVIKMPTPRCKGLTMTDKPEPPRPTVKVIPASVPDLPPHLQWPGEGPPPASWYAADGTKVYRSYEDYCND